MTWFCEFVLERSGDSRGLGRRTLCSNSQTVGRHRALRNLLVQHGKCQQCLVKEG